jgi:hypothetical protein
MKRGTLDRSHEKPKPAQVWALRKATGDMQAVYERWSSQAPRNLRLLSTMGRLEEAMKDSTEAENG